MFSEIFIGGFVGAVAIEIVNVLHYLKNAGGISPKAKKVSFWIVKFAIAILAGLLPVGYGIRNTILAAHLGAATPLLAQSMARLIVDDG